MKVRNFLLVVLLTFLSVNLSAKTFKMIEPADSTQKLLIEYSLFNESQKNKDYESAEPHGWYVVNHNPKKFLKYRIFKKMDKMMNYFFEKAQTPEEKSRIADTTIYLYKVALENEKDKEDYYWAKIAYVHEMWKESPADTIIKYYKKAWEVNPQLSPDWLDRLGLVYTRFADDETNDYRIQALELYSKLSELEPDNALWPKRLEALAGGDAEKLVEILKKAWDLDKENLEKAWKYASACLRNKDYEKAVEPLEFLTKKAPTVINYWKQLATVYQKLGNNDKAIAANKTLIDLQPDNRDNYLNLALVYKDLGQLSVARSYLYKAMKADPNWAYPYYIEGQLYEQAARDCSKGGLSFMDKCVFKLAVDTYLKAKGKEGQYAQLAVERAKAFNSTVPQKEDYFFRKLKSGDKVKIEGNCYGWIGRSIIVP